MTRRVSIADIRDAHATARFPLWFELLLWGQTDAVPCRLAAEPGTFEVHVTTLSGLPVDRTTYEVEWNPPAIVAGPFVDADASGRFGPAAAGTACEPFRAGGIEGAIIGVAVENPGELPAAPELFLHPAFPPNAEGRAVLESSLAGDSGALPPGETGCLALELDSDEVERLRDSGGVGYLGLRVRGESVDKTRVELPTASEGNDVAS